MAVFSSGSKESLLINKCKGLRFLLAVLRLSIKALGLRQSFLFPPKRLAHHSIRAYKKAKYAFKNPFSDNQVF
jgi:hypothetical protein